MIAQKINGSRSLAARLRKKTFTGSSAFELSSKRAPLAITKRGMAIITKEL